MALLAEELVEEWLNRQGYFTIRGAKLGVHEIDLLAIRWTGNKLECRHIEVQASIRPVSYLTPLSKSVQKSTGRPRNSAKVRSDKELTNGIREWITKKYDHPAKVKLRNQLAPGPWTRELVVHRVRHEREVELIKAENIRVTRLGEVVAALNGENPRIAAAAGAHLVDLVNIVVG